MEQRKIIIHFVPGSYGNFLEGLLNKSLKLDKQNRSDFHWTENDYSTSNFVIERSHDYEAQTQKSVVKITYDFDDTALINRNKWTKWPQNYEESKAHAFENTTLDVDETTKEIVTKSYFRSDLLKNIDKWNKKINDHTYELPFKFFLSDTEEWISKAKKILDRFNLHTYESDYLEKACAIFQRSQLGIWQKNKRNHDLIDWQEKDTTEKANVLGHLHYLKIYKDGKPMPPPIYSNTPEMLATWVKILDSNGTVK